MKSKGAWDCRGKALNPAGKADPEGLLRGGI